MPARSAETTATTSAGGSVTSCRLAEAATIRVGRPVISVGIAVGRPVIIIVTIDLIAITAAGTRRVIRSSSPRPVCPLVAVACGTGDQTIAVACAVESPQMRIDSSSRVFGTGYDHSSAIIRIVEIRVVPAIPHKVAVPAHVGISEAQAEPGSESQTQSITITIGRVAISISQTNTQTGRIIGIIGAVIVKI